MLLLPLKLGRPVRSEQHMVCKPNVLKSRDEERAEQSDFLALITCLSTDIANKMALSFLFGDFFFSYSALWVGPW